MASFVALVQHRLGIDPVLEAGVRGQFDVFADGELVVSRGGNWFTRRLGAGWPDFETVIAGLERRQAQSSAGKS